MRIAVILTDYKPSGGGAYTFQGSVLRALLAQAAGSRHHFVLLTDPTSLPALPPLPANVTSLGLKSDPARDKLRLGLRAQVRRLANLSLLRLPIERALASAGADCVWFVSGSGVELDTPYFATIWDLQHRRQPWFPEVSAGGEWSNREAAYRRYLQRAALILAPNPTAQSELELFYGIPAERVALLPHPTPDLPAALPADPCAVLHRFNLPEPFLFYPAQFWAHKNHVNLLHALQVLRDEHNLIFHLALTGSDKGNQAHVRAEVARLGLSEQVHFLGFVSDEELSALYQTAFALAFPSFFGPENLPPLEAFSRGCPVICARYAGAEEQLGDAALLFGPRDPAELADCIRRLLDEPALRETLTARGRARAAAWTSNDFVRRVLDLLDDFERVRRCWPSP